MNGDQAIHEIHTMVKDLRVDVTSVMMGGCAKREGDLARMANVEDGIKSIGSKMDNLFWTTLITAMGIIAFLLKAFLPVAIKHIIP